MRKTKTLTIFPHFSRNEWPRWHWCCVLVFDDHKSDGDKHEAWTESTHTTEFSWRKLIEIDLAKSIWTFQFAASLQMGVGLKLFGAARHPISLIWHCTIDSRTPFIPAISGPMWHWCDVNFLHFVGRLKPTAIIHSSLSVHRWAFWVEIFDDSATTHNQFA